MREVPASILTAWRSGVTIGDTRPMVRVTLQKPMMRLVNTGDNLFASYLFGTQQGTPRELPNVLSLESDRGVDNDVDTATLTLLNVAPLPIGTTPPTEDFDLLGHYTPQRGKSDFSSRWNHEPNEWAEGLVPDNLIRTYEGYGFDADVCPSADPHLVQSGVWSILRAKFTHDGRIVVELRGLEGPLLNDQIAFPPVVPFSAGPVAEAYPKGKYAYPVQFQAINPEPIINRKTHVNVARVPLTYDDSSNTPYISSKNATYRGHRLSEAFDGDTGTYWLSVGNARRDQGYSYEWVQGKCAKSKVQRVRFKTKGTGYTAYIGIYADGAWLTSDEGGLVPYDPDHPASAPNFADENFVTAVPVGTEGWIEVDLPETYENVSKVRITLANLWDSDLGPYQYRGAVREVQAYAPSTSRTTETVTTFDLKNYDDYTDIVKLFLAWAGFFWPSGAYELDCEGNQMPRTWTKPDNSLPIAGSGRVWGDFKLSGTYGPATLGVELFDKKPLLDCIKYVQDILGYIFFIDETGGAVFRPPNIYRLGNWIRSLTRTNGRRSGGAMPRIDEMVTLEGLESVLDGASQREGTFVSNTDGTHGALAPGFIPNYTGLRRMGGWTDQNFETQGEVEIMADMITLRQLFQYRQDQIKIRGNPQIQVDDQIQVYERVTNEGYVHYVRSIKSNNDLVSGEWTYDLTTHWLGERPFERWLFDPKQLGHSAQRYLEELYGSGEEQV